MHQHACSRPESKCAHPRVRAAHPANDRPELQKHQHYLAPRMPRLDTGDSGRDFPTALVVDKLPCITTNPTANFVILLPDYGRATFGTLTALACEREMTFPVGWCTIMGETAQEINDNSKQWNSRTESIKRMGNATHPALYQVRIGAVGGWWVGGLIGWVHDNVLCRCTLHA